MAQYILAHDIGTTGNKATVYDVQGKLIASSYDEYPCNYFGNNCAEQDPIDWWNAICSSTRKVLGTPGISPKEISCVSFSGHMMGCVAVDKDANPLRPAIIWADSRSVDQAQRLIDKVGMEDGYKITGHRLLPMYSAAKIMWIMDNEPDIFRETYKFLHTKDFIVAKMTGKFVTDYSDASGMNLLDLKTRDWSEPLIKASRIPVEVLPEVHPSTYIAGGVTRKASGETGLAVGTPVVIGGGDGPCAAVGAGVVSEGSAYNYFGSAAWIGISTGEPLYDPEMRTFVFIHLDPDLYMPTGASNNGGYSYQWFGDAVWTLEKKILEDLGSNIYNLMEKKAERIHRGASKLLFLPYIRGERCPYDNANARGAFIGLNPNHTKADLTRAVLEGVAFNQRIILDALEGLGGKIGKDMWVIGGGAQSPLWRQIMADIYDKRIIQPRILQEATSLGAAVAGGVGTGLFENFAAAEKMIEAVNVHEPNPVAHADYNKLYEVFKSAYDKIETIFGELAELS